MSLNSIQLHPQLLAALYEHSLVDETKKAAATAFKYLGKNAKNILIMVCNTDVAFLEERELVFLSNVLAACKLNIADIAIVNQASLPAGTSYSSLLHFFNSQSVLMFDVDAQSIDLPFNFPHFQLQQFDQHLYLSAPSLKNIESDKTLKTRLWNCLKSLFEI